MALSIPDIGDAIPPGADTQSFESVGVVKTQQNTNTQTNIDNNTSTQTATNTRSDSTGGELTDDAAAVVANNLENLAPITSQTPGTPSITETSSSSQTNVNTVTPVITADPSMKFLVADTLANSSYAFAGTPCTGTAGVSSQYIVQTDNPTLTAANLNITALAPGVFIHTGSGIDAISVASVGGTNILDGGTNSNFLVGGAAGSGTDTFFVDARGAGSDVWSTISGFHAGDAVTLFGITPASKAIAWVDNEGAPGATGLTLHATEAGAPQVSFTLAGYTTADLSNGRLGVTYGAETDGTPYLYVVGLT